MAKLYVTEFVAQGTGTLTAPKCPPLAEQTVAIGGTTTQSSAFNGATSLILVHTDAICSISIGVNPTATTSTSRMAANETRQYVVNPGEKIAVITNT